MKHLRTKREFIECEVIVTPGKYDFKPYAIGYQKDSPYAELFNFYIDQMRENGVIESIRNKYQGLPQQCPDLRLVKAIWVAAFIEFLD